MNFETIAILMPGDMGHAVGRVLKEHGHRVITCLDGRSAHTRGLAQAGGLEDVGTLARAVEEADMILSILPPAAALAQAKAVGKLMPDSGAPVYVDCNAVSPGTAKEIGATITNAGADFIDAGIIGLAPRAGAGPRFYVSGPTVAPMEHLNGKGFAVIGIGEEIGQASALKMAYAGLTKGTWTLQTAVLLAAQQLGVAKELIDEFEISQQGPLQAMRARVPFLPADSARWVGEMEQISQTFADAGVPSGFHEGAAEIFRILERTPFASETRQTLDTTRTLEEAIEVYCEHLKP